MQEVNLNCVGKNNQKIIYIFTRLVITLHFTNPIHFQSKNNVFLQVRRVMMCSINLQQETVEWSSGNVT